MQDIVFIQPIASPAAATATATATANASTAAPFMGLVVVVVSWKESER